MSFIDWGREFFTGAKVISNPGKDRPDGADKVETDPSKDGRPASGDNTKAAPAPPPKPPKEPKEPRPHKNDP